MIFKIFIVLVAATAVLGGTSRPNSLFPTGGKIVGGSNAGAGEIPWQVSIQTTGNFQSCGGSIIGSNWILTAAHCSEIDPSRYQIRAGSLQYASGGSVHSIDEVVVHPDYNINNNFINDIALWRVSPAFSFDANANIVGLPSQGQSTDAGTIITVSGWGTTSFGGSVSESLLKVDIPIVSKSECDDNYAAQGGIRANQICAGVSEGGVDSCQGDSGGPLYKDGVQLGIVSNGNGCAWPGYPGVYTEVSGFRDWIKSVTGI